MGEKRDRPPEIPTGWAQRGAMLAGQTGRSAARFLGTRVRSFATPGRAQELLDGFHKQTASQVVDMLGEMKGAAMKLGQLASFYEFEVPGEHLDVYKDALTMLQNSAPPIDPEAAKRVISQEFDKPVSEIFDDFEDVPVASASIGQVHRAVLPTGETVAVKVQYPGVDEAVRADVKNLSALTKLSLAIAPNLDPKEIANEVKDRVLEELDYEREARNQARFASLYAEHPFIYVPKVFPEFCRTRVITQEFVSGEHFTSAYEWAQPEKDRLGEILFRFFYGSFDRFLVFSADPHPGNYKLLPDGRVAFLDFGLVREIDSKTLHLLLDVVTALIADDTERGRVALESLGILGSKTPEITAVWDHLKMLNRPVLEDRDFTMDLRLTQAIAAAAFDPRSSAFQTMRKIGIPGVMITFNRMSFGVASLLSRLGATANWHAIAREMWTGQPSDTELGKLEMEWLARVHPDHRPPLDSIPSG
ncbi:MAG TPA: AarF/ABC1/UbiB kinase family protein [Actinomycetota bacterium]|nr:AarF/ABC1/UbiB kinase family protein [Actinomycetota bacterium]